MPFRRVRRGGALSGAKKKGAAYVTPPLVRLPPDLSYQDLVMATPYRRGSAVITLVNRPELSSVV